MDRIGREKWQHRQIMLLLAGLLCLVPGVVMGQNCYDYPCVIRKVKEALVAKRYQSAFDNLESAAAYPGSNAEEIADLRQQLFNSIQREKEQAETERQRAEQAEGRVRSTLRIVQEERDRSEVLRKAAERNSEINRITAQAMEVQAEDPGLAANLAHYAFELSDRGHPLAAKIRRNMYQDPAVLLLRTALQGHRAEVTAMAFSPDGRYILTGSKDRTAILWDFKGTILRHFTGHAGSVTAVAFAPDGRHVVTSSQDHDLKLWDLEGHELHTFSGHLRAIKQVVFSTDGKLLLSEAGDGLRLWQISGEELAAKFEESQGRLEAISFTEDDRRIVGVDTYGAVKKWDRSGQLLDKAEMNIDNLLTAAFSQRGDRLLVNSIGGKTLLWATESNRVEREMPNPSAFRAAGFSAVDDHILIARTEGVVEAWELSGRKRGAIRQMGSAHSLIDAVFSADGRWMLSLSPAGLPKLWDLSVGRQLLLGGHREAISAMVTAPDGSQIYTGSSDGSIIAWSADGKIRWRAHCYAGSVRSMAVTADGTRLIIGGENGQVELRSHEGSLLSTVQGSAYRFGYVNSVAVSPDGNYLLLASVGGHVQLIALETGAQRDFSVQKEDVFSLAFSPDGTEVLLGGLEGVVWRCDLEGNLLHTYRADTDRTINRVTFTPDGRYLLAAKGADICIWDPEGTLIRTLAGHQYDITDLAISNDGQLILSSSPDKTARLWSIQGELLQTLEAHQGMVSAVAFLRDCDTCPWKLATAGADQTIRIFDREGQLTRVLGGHPAEVRAVAYAPDGTLMATAGRAGEIRLWDADGQLRTLIPAHDRSVETLAFAPDGQSLLSGSLDHTVKQWDRNGRLLQTFEGQERGIKAILFFPDGKKWCTAAGSELIIRDIEGYLLASYEAPFNISGLAIAPDGQQVALAGGEGRVVRLNPEGKLLDELQTTPVPIFDLAFSPNGQELLLGLEREGALLLDLKGQVIQHLETGPSSVMAVAFAPVCENCAYRPGEVLATGSADGSVILWNRQGLELQRSELGPKAVSDLEFTPDGTRLLVGTTDHNAVVLYQVEAYFGDRSAVSYPQSATFGLPFDYRQLSDPGAILEYGTHYLGENNTQQEMSLEQLATAREVTEYLVDRFGDGYRIYLAEVLYNYAKYHFRRGAFTPAVEAYQKIMAYDPSTAWLDLELATTWLFAGNWTETKTIYDRWLGQPWDRSVSDYARNWGEAFYKYLDQASERVTPRDEALVARAKNYLLEAMSK